MSYLLDTIEEGIDAEDLEIPAGDLILDGDLFDENDLDGFAVFGHSALDDFDPDRDPFGWDITDTFDWDSMDYEYGD
jgi:hypothetical protein